jgi:hypothetical protein
LSLKWDSPLLKLYRQALLVDAFDKTRSPNSDAPQLQHQ